ncbi:zinc knuckle CX2CX4HX4C containing protein [Tanacetum coccineum]
MSTGDAVAGSLIDKIRNIDGKIVKDGKLRTAMRGVAIDTPGTFVASLDSFIREKNTSFAEVVSTTANPSMNSHAKQAVKIKEMRNSEVVAGAHVAIPLAAVEETKEGMDKVIESGPWLIRLVPLILNVWTPNAILKKDVIRSAPVWAKLYHVPVVAYSEVGLSLITTQIGHPIMLDTYTSSMCLSSWGRKEYARALIEVSADEELLDSMIIAIPLGYGMGHSFATIDIEYEWKPPRCSTCKIFDHTNDGCPKNPNVIEVSNGTSDGFTEVRRKKNKSKQNRQIEGIKFTKPKLNLQYRKVDKGESSKTNANPITKPPVAPDHPKVNKPPDQRPSVSLSNSFNALETNDNDTYDTFWGPKDQCDKSFVLNESDSEGEEMVLEDKNGKPISKEGASTPVVNVSS